MSLDSEVPFAESMRPQILDDLQGHEEIWAKGKPLRQLVETDRFSAILLWGPPGSGKTSLAHVIGQHSQHKVVVMSAVEDGVKAIREQINRSQIRKNHDESCLLIFMDEIHRLNKGQQDVLLPALEKGVIKFIGATTENPSFSVNNAIISRCLVFQLHKLSTQAVVAILERALTLPESRHYHRQVHPEVLQTLADATLGDARQALTLLDSVLNACSGNEEVLLDSVRELINEIVGRYDKSGDHHYDIISAFIKSIRASKPDAALYYLARMIDGGEDPMFIARRLVIAASEDIGNANPTALLLATSTLQSVANIGMPEARIILSQVTCYLAACPKSNRSYKAIDLALADVKGTGNLDIPLHLRNAPSRLMKDLGYGQGYIYPHDHPQQASRQEYLPDELVGRQYYTPSQSGAEKQLADNLRRLNSTEKK